MVKLQKRILRIIFDQPFRAHTNELFLRSKILKLQDVHSFLLSQFIYKNLSKFENISSQAYVTRQSSSLRPSFQRLALAQKSIYYAAPTAWNLIPLDIRQLECFRRFKIELRNYYLSSYSLDR